MKQPQARDPGGGVPEALLQLVLRVFGQRRGRLGGTQHLRLPLQHLHTCDPGMSVQWQVVDKRIPLYANHKTILQKVAALFGAFY